MLPHVESHYHILEQASRDIMRLIGWMNHQNLLKKMKKCEVCQQPLKLSSSHPYFYFCSNRHLYPLGYGTLFGHFRIPLDTQLHLLFSMQQNETIETMKKWSESRLVKMNCKGKRIWYIPSRITVIRFRNVVLKRIFDFLSVHPPIFTKTSITESDEAYRTYKQRFQGINGNGVKKWRKRKQLTIFGIVQRQPHLIWLQIIPNTQISTIDPIIRMFLVDPFSNIPGTHIHCTDATSYYQRLSSRFPLTHRMAKHEKRKKKTSEPTQTEHLYPAEQARIDRPVNLSLPIVVRSGFSWNDEKLEISVNTCHVDRLWETLKSKFLRPHHNYYSTRMPYIISWFVFIQNKNSIWRLVMD